MLRGAPDTGVSVESAREMKRPPAKWLRRLRQYWDLTGPSGTTIEGYHFALDRPFWLRVCGTMGWAAVSWRRMYSCRWRCGWVGYKPLAHNVCPRCKTYTVHKVSP